MNQSITTSPPGSEKNIRRYLLFWAILVCLSLIVSFSLDRLILYKIVRQIIPNPRSGFVFRTLESLKEFGQPVAITVTCLLIFLLDKSRRWMLPRLLLCIILPLVLVWPIKLTIHRLRPRCIDEHNTTLGLGFFWGSQPTPPAWAHSLPNRDKIVIDSHLSRSDMQSFPSAHTATALGFAVGLSAMYPPARLVFYALAAGCGFHRILFDAHWFSDVVASAFIGLFVSRAVWRWRNRVTQSG